MLLALKDRVIVAQRHLRVDILDGDEPDIGRRMRVLGNFAEHVPMALILIGILELNGAETWIIHALGNALMVVRVLHVHRHDRSYRRGRAAHLAPGIRYRLTQAPPVP